MIFQKMIEQCGLNQIEAAEFLGYSYSAVKKWSLETRRPPEDIVLKMANLNDQITGIAFKIAVELQKNNTKIGDYTTTSLLTKFSSILKPTPSFDSIKEACIARAFMIAPNVELGKKDK
ncbi:helix-turn-helix domain-containing protein [Bartonella apis]|uniref:helix-turn-helix domain-containing protein n=1 Tax=Bartonella apis TaxID=1686310 RepID=UPI00242F9B26|nr:helix-turn-helix transcriptional regulator [Bartonella apis]